MTKIKVYEDIVNHVMSDLIDSTEANTRYTIYELEEKFLFNLSTESVILILNMLHEREEVAEATLEHGEIYVTFYTDFCPMYDGDNED